MLSEDAGNQYQFAGNVTPWKEFVTNISLGASCNEVTCDHKCHLTKRQATKMSHLND